MPLQHLQFTIMPLTEWRFLLCSSSGPTGTYTFQDQFLKCHFSKFLFIWQFSFTSANFQFCCPFLTAWLANQPYFSNQKFLFTSANFGNKKLTSTDEKIVMAQHSSFLFTSFPYGSDPHVRVIANDGLDQQLLQPSGAWRPLEGRRGGGLGRAVAVGSKGSWWRRFDFRRMSGRPAGRPRSFVPPSSFPGSLSKSSSSAAAAAATSTMMLRGRGERERPRCSQDVICIVCALRMKRNSFAVALRPKAKCSLQETRRGTNTGEKERRRA